MQARSRREHPRTRQQRAAVDWAARAAGSAAPDSLFCGQDLFRARPDRPDVEGDADLGRVGAASRRRFSWSRNGTLGDPRAIGDPTSVSPEDRSKHAFWLQLPAPRAGGMPVAEAAVHARSTADRRAASIVTVGGGMIEFDK